jgi:ABC-type sugar transport system permease subunit
LASCFRNITWPQLTPAINTNFLLNIIGSLQAWQLFLVLIGYQAGHTGSGLRGVRRGLRSDR